MNEVSPRRGVSLVLPVCNEAESLPLLFTEISEVAEKHSYDLQVIFIDDGSTDESWRIIRELSANDSRIEAVRFRRNFGKAAALSAGFRLVKHPVCLTLDADLQDDPHEIPNFIALLDSGLDVISGWKKKRYDPWHKVIPSRFFNSLVSRITGVKLHDHNCGMKIYRREVLSEMRLYGELHRVIPVLAASRGFKVGELVINHRPRRFGSSKYGVKRFVKGFLDLMTVKFLTNFGARPQHLLGTWGLLSFGAGMLALTYLAITWVIRYLAPDSGFEPLHQRALLPFAVGGLLLGSQLLSVGLLAEMIAANNAREEDAYSISERIESSGNKSSI